MNILSLKNLSVGYKNIIIKNINFDIQEREIVGILGLNGSGKSTLLGGICGINKIFGGDIFVGDTKINTFSSKKRAQFISYFTQRTPAVEGLTVRQIIEMGCYSKSPNFFSTSYQNKKNEIISSCAKLLKIEHLLDVDITRLSEGQRSLAFLAKIFAQNTPIILLDEPDNNLDYLNTHKLFRTFKDLVESQNKSALMVLHNPTLALNYCGRLIVINQGKIHGEIGIKNATLADIQSLLCEIYPDIIVKQDSDTGLLYTMFANY